MKRIGLVIYLTIVLGLILNISLISKFGYLVDRNILVLGLVVVNCVVLGFTVNKMLVKRLYVSHIVLMNIVYLWILFQLTSSMFFTIDISKDEKINTSFIVKDYRFYEGFNQYICDIKEINGRKVYGKEGSISTNSEVVLGIGDVVNGDVMVSNDYGYAYSLGAEISCRLVDYKVIGEKFKLNKYLVASQNKIKTMLNSALTDEYGDVIGAFIIGTNFENTDTKNALITTGIYHIMAISGLHIGILVSGVLGILNLVFYRRNAMKLTILLVILYGLITGMSFSTTRAIIVVTIGLIGLIHGTKDDKLNTVAVAGSLILIFNPLAIFNMGYIYSFSIVFGLILTSPSIKYVLKTILKLSYDKEYKVLDYIVAIITAQLYFIPLCLYANGSLYIYSFFANLLTIFVVPVLFGSSVLVLLFYGTFLDSVFVWLTKFLVDYIINVANFFVGLPQSEINIGVPSKFFIGSCYVVLFGASYYLTKNVVEVNNGHFSKVKVFKER